LINDPILSWDGGKMWELVDDWHVKVGVDEFIIGAGFRFDLASIPRILWVVPGFAPFELSTAAPLLHDFIYKYKGWPEAGKGYRITRRTADRYFRIIMAEEGVGRVRRLLAWLAVRVGGYLSWRQL
jgi:hypothetical protein